MTFKLISANIKNYRSLEDVNLEFRDLTILVGANSSGKSNCLQALQFLNILLRNASTPPVHLMETILRLDTEQICYEILVKDEEDNQAEYNISVKVDESQTFISREYLRINGTEVIDISNGEGTVKDEDGSNSQKYKSDHNSDNLALTEAGNYGDKPLTKRLANYIKNWQLYDIDPDGIRSYDANHNIFSPFVKVLIQNNKKTPSKFQQTHDSITPRLNSSASRSHEILVHLAINDRDKFEQISQEIRNCLQIRLNFSDEKQIITAIEGNGQEISLSNMSDGTLRLLAYCILLYESDIPVFVGIEEPERNFHPGILKDIASIIKQLSQKTQVIFTTHSSQLLDCFSPEEISSEISVILLSKKGESGTQACLLDKLAERRDDLSEWMTDFGLGSAIYSQLIQEVLGS